MTRYLTALLILGCACGSSRPVSEDIEYGGPVIPPEGPSEIIIGYVRSSGEDRGEVVCTLVPAGRDWRAERCRACVYPDYQYLYGCFDPDYPPEWIRWDRSGEIIPRALVDNVFEAMQDLPKVEKMRKCRFATDNYESYYADIRFPDSTGVSPIRVRRGEGDCAPHHVIQGENKWCNCSSFGLGAIVEYLGGLHTGSYMPCPECHEFCSCFEDFCWNGPCLW